MSFIITFITQHYHSKEKMLLVFWLQKWGSKLTTTIFFPHFSCHKCLREEILEYSLYVYVRMALFPITCLTCSRLGQDRGWSSEGKKCHSIPVCLKRPTVLFKYYSTYKHFKTYLLQIVICLRCFIKPYLHWFQFFSVF